MTLTLLSEPTAVAMLETQRMLFFPAKDAPEFSAFAWADAIPKLLQARLIESFENYDIAHAPLHAADTGQPDFELLVDVRHFRVTLNSESMAEIALSARMLNKDGKVIASRLFEESEKVEKLEPQAAVAAFDAAFDRIARNMLDWTVQALP